MAHRHKPNNTVFAAACVVGRCAVCALMSSHAAPATRPCWRATTVPQGNVRRSPVAYGSRAWKEWRERGPFGAGWLASAGWRWARLALLLRTREIARQSRLKNHSTGKEKSWPDRPRGGDRRCTRLTDCWSRWGGGRLLGSLPARVLRLKGMRLPTAIVSSSSSSSSVLCLPRSENWRGNNVS